MKIQLLIISLAIVLKVPGQNLVPNSSFEEYKDCPEGNYSYQQIKSWINCILQFDTPDLFNICSISLHVPNSVVNEYGIIHRTPHSGQGFIGMIVIHNEDKDDRELIQCKLKEALVNKKRYHVEFYVSLGPQSKMAIILPRNLDFAISP